MLRVAHIASETPTVETYRLVPVDGTELPFDYLPGQFLQVEVEPEPGRSLRRSYTIASSPTQRAFVEITVKREERGSVSRYLNAREIEYLDDLTCEQVVVSGLRASVGLLTPSNSAARSVSHM